MDAFFVVVRSSRSDSLAPGRGIGFRIQWSQWPYGGAYPLSLHSVSASFTAAG